MSNIQISIVKGTYRGKTICGVYPLVKGYVDGARGGYVTIKNPDHDEGTPMVQRIQLERDAFTLLDAQGEELAAHIVVGTEAVAGGVTSTTDYEAAFAAGESEEDAMERIRSTFTMLDKITDAAARGVVRGLVVSGPPGIGKSFGVEKQLAAANMFRVIEGKDPKFEVISGGVSPIGLYQKLYQNRNPQQVIVFDDADGVLLEEESLTLLKAALNSGDKRRICWNKESRVLLNDDIPNAFDFEGVIIFLTNIDFAESISKGSRLAAHLEAIMSRCHYLDLEIGSMRDKLLRIKQIVQEGMLTQYEFTAQQEADIVSFIVDNAEYMRETSLRAVKKIADLVVTDATEWHSMAEAMLLTRDAKFKRLYTAKQQKLMAEGLAIA